MLPKTVSADPDRKQTLACTLFNYRLTYGAPNGARRGSAALDWTTIASDQLIKASK